MQELAIKPKKKSDEQRLFDVLHKLEMEISARSRSAIRPANETVSCTVSVNPSACQTFADGSAMQDQLDTKPPQIDYRRTITGKAPGHCGGRTVAPIRRSHAGVEPSTWRRLRVRRRIKGGTIAGVFMASVEKGVRAKR